MVYGNAYELGYRIYRRENWGKGYMSEAGASLVDQKLGLMVVPKTKVSVLVARWSGIMGGLGDIKITRIVVQAISVPKLLRNLFLETMIS